MTEPTKPPTAPSEAVYSRDDFDGWERVAYDAGFTACRERALVEIDKLLGLIAPSEAAARPILRSLRRRIEEMK